MKSTTLRFPFALAAALLALGATGCKDKLVGIYPVIEVNPTSLAFGQSAVGSAQQIRVSITNVGSAPLQISSIKVASDPNNELSVRDLLTTDCNNQAISGDTTLLPAACARFTVRWSASGLHAATGAIEIDSNDPQNPVVTLPVTGDAIAPQLRYCILTAAGAVDPNACSDLGASPAVIPTVDFGTSLPGVSTTRTVRVFNKGGAALVFAPQPQISTTGSADYSFTGTIPGGQLAPSASADFAITVNPSTSGTITSGLDFASNDFSVPQLEVPLTINVPTWKLCIDPAGGLNFGILAVGQTLTKTVTFTNCGNADFTVKTFHYAPTAPTTTQFTIPPTDLPALNSTFSVGAAIALPVTFTPTVQESDAGEITYAFTIGALTVSGTVPIIGGSTGPTISVTPMTLAFGSILIGSPQQIRVSVSNIGTAPLLVSAIKVATDPNSELSVTDLLTTDCNNASRSGGTTLAPGECARFTVAWAPQAAHAASGSIEIDSNDLTNPAVTLPVTGSATTPPLLQVCVLDATGNIVPTQCSSLASTPHIIPTVDFGHGLLSVAKSLKVRLTNQGQNALNFAPVPALSATTPADFVLTGSVPGATLAAGATTDLTVTVTPSSAGTLTGALNISSNDLRAPTLAVPLQVVVGGWALCVSPTAGLNFGALSIGQTQTQTVTFTNCGNADLTVSTFSFAPTSPTTTQFALPVSPTLPPPASIFAVGASLALPITYKPTVVQNDAAGITYAFTVGGATLQGTVPIVGQGTVPACGSSGAANPTVNVVTGYSTDQTGSGTFTTFSPATTPSPVIPLDWVKLDASTSVVSAGAATYSWTLTTQPAGSTTTLSAATGPVVQMQTLVSGTYVVAVTVKDKFGCTTAKSITIQVVPVGAIHIELTWAEGCGDLDIHYVAPGGAVCDGRDLFYENLAAYGGTPPDWGCAAGKTCSGAPSEPGGNHADLTAVDDATLDHDNVTGYGPENVTQKAPFDSPASTPYQVWVYYYNDGASGLGGGCGLTHPTVRVYVNGVYNLGFVLTSGMNYHNRWHAIDINVANAGTKITVAAPPGTTGQNFFTTPGACSGETPL